MQTGSLQAERGHVWSQDPGIVYGVALNHRGQLADVMGQLTAPPYLRPPKAPVLYIKTPNTYLVGGGEVAVGADGEVELKATLAVKIGRAASRVASGDAYQYIAGFAAALDVSAPGLGWFRPDVRQRCQDGFLPLASTFTPLINYRSTDNVEIALAVDGAERSRWSTLELVRSIETLIEEITDFMTLDAGDVLLIGHGPELVLGRPGQRARAHVTGAGEVNCTLKTASPG